MVYQSLLLIHIISGGASLLSGAFAASTKKGARYHKLSGNIFFVSLVMAAIAAIAITFLRPNVFLQSIGLFTIYMSVSGRMAFSELKKIKLAITTFGILAALYLLIVAFLWRETIGLVPAVFGLIQLLFIRADLISFKGIDNRIAYHASRMGGAFIASNTAFVVVSLDFIPWYVVWFMPAIVGTFLIIKGIRNFKQPKTLS